MQREKAKMKISIIGEYNSSFFIKNLSPNFGLMEISALEELAK
jgi:hypothetical protein